MPRLPWLPAATAGCWTTRAAYLVYTPYGYLPYAGTHLPYPGYSDITLLPRACGLQPCAQQQAAGYHAACATVRVLYRTRFCATVLLVRHRSLRGWLYALAIQPVSLPAVRSLNSAVPTPLLPAVVACGYRGLGSTRDHRLLLTARMPLPALPIHRIQFAHRPQFIAGSDTSRAYTTTRTCRCPRPQFWITDVWTTCGNTAAPLLNSSRAAGSAVPVETFANTSLPLLYRTWRTPRFNASGHHKPPFFHAPTAVPKRLCLVAADWPYAIAPLLDHSNRYDPTVDASPATFHLRTAGLRTGLCAPPTVGLRVRCAAFQRLGHTTPAVPSPVWTQRFAVSGSPAGITTVTRQL